MSLPVRRLLQLYDNECYYRYSGYYSKVRNTHYDNVCYYRYSGYYSTVVLRKPKAGIAFYVTVYASYRRLPTAHTSLRHHNVTVC